MASLCLVSYKMSVRLDLSVRTEMGIHQKEELARTLVSLLSAIQPKILLEMQQKFY